MPMYVAITEAQAGFLVKLIMNVHANHPHKRMALLGEVPFLTKSAASALIDALKAQEATVHAATVTTVVEKVAATIAVAIPSKGVHLLIGGVKYQVKPSKHKPGVYHAYAGGGYVGTVGFGKTEKVDAILMDKVAYEAAVVGYGAVTARCGFCNTKLKDPVSVAQKMGPVCKKKYL